VDDDLSYFEYTTFLSLFCFESCDYIIFEAGLGGEFDATSTIKSDLTLVTTIDFDHQEFLGDSIKSIAKTKLRATKEEAIIGVQIHLEVFDVAKELNIKYMDYRELFDEEIEMDYPVFLKNNLKLAIATLKRLNFDVDMKLFENIEFLGRFQKIAPNVTIDVGHNPLSAKEISKSLGNSHINLIYNTYSDKNYREILEILAPNIKKIYILKFENSRLERLEKLTTLLHNMKLDCEIFNRIDVSENYLVYGSFSVVEEFLKRCYSER
jgi:dihydrofolate synthase/folylpolyglutamate synthase